MRRKLLVVFALVVFGVPFLLDLGPGTARADDYAGRSGTWCDTAPHVLFTMSLDGTVATVRVRQQKVTIPATTVVREYWLYTRPGGGASSPGNFVMQGPGTFWDGYVIDGLNGEARYLSITMVQGSTGTLTLYAQKPADYDGGCYTVDNVGVTVLKYQGGAGGTPPDGGGAVSPNPSPTPSPTQPPSPEPGWCVDPDYDPSVPGAGPYIPCELAPSPSPTPTPTPDCDVWEPITLLDPDGTTERQGYTLRVCGYSWSQADAGYYEVGSLPALPAIATGSGGLKRFTFRIGTTSQSTDGDSKSALCLSTGYYPTGSLPGGCVGWVWPSQTSITASYTTPADGTVLRQFWDSGWGTAGGTVGSSGDATTGGGRYWWYPAFSVLTNPWEVADVSPTPTPAPSATPATPTLPPSFAPSLPPNPYVLDSEGNVIDCSAAEWNGKEICADVRDYSFAPGAMDPDGVAQLLDTLEQKAPFGYAAQAAEAVTDAAAGAAGAAMPECFTLGTGAYAVEVCLPLDEVSGALSPWRNVFLAMVLIVIGLGVIRLAQAASGGGTSGGAGA